MLAPPYRLALRCITSSSVWQMRLLVSEISLI